MRSNFSENVKQTNVIARKFNDPPGNKRLIVRFAPVFPFLFE